MIPTIVADQPLAETLLSLQRNVIDIEARNAVAAVRTETAQDAGNVAFNADLKEIAKEVNHHLDQLMVARLIEGRRSAPVLHSNDVDRILQLMLRGDKVDVKVLSMLRMLQPIVEMNIALRLSIFDAIHAHNIHAAFWLFSRAIINQALTDNITPGQAVATQEGRIGIYRQIMTPETWKELNRKRVAQLAGIDPSKLLSAAAGVMTESAAADLQKQLDELETPLTSESAAYAKRVGAYYVALGRKIWPAHKQA